MEDRIVSRRRMTGMSAVLVPFTEAGAIEWGAAEAHIDRARASTDATPPSVPRRPDADRVVLTDILDRLAAF